MQTKDYPNARKAFARMFGVPGDSAAAYLFTARMLLRRICSGAEEYAKKAVELDPKLPRAHMLLGELYLYKSRIPEAVEQFQKELELNPGEPRCTTNWQMPTAVCRSMRKRKNCCEVPSGSILTATGPVYLDGEGFGEERRDRPCRSGLHSPFFPLA